MNATNKIHCVLCVFLIINIGAASQNLTRAEYFFDTDVGLGTATQITVIANDSVDFIADIPLTGLQAGYHTLFIRFANNNNVWGHYESRTIYIHPNMEFINPQLVSAEYFFDTDPGIGNGTTIGFTAGMEVDITTDVSTTGLEPGYHTLFIRFIDENNLWGHYENRTIYVQPNINSQTYILTDAEYFIDIDTGIGNGTPITFTAGNEANFTLNVPISGFEASSSHKIFVRFMNEGLTWGIYEYGYFTVENCSEPEPDFSFDNKCVNSEVTFTDESTGIFTETTYAWDIDNNGTVDYTNKSNITHTYTEAGIYEVRLQLTNPGGCTKMQLHQIEIYPDYNTTTFDSICQGDEYIFGTQTLTQTGSYTEVFQSVGGCDSTVVLSLNVLIVDVSVHIQNNTIVANAENCQYQWVDCNNNDMFIDNATEQSYTPTINGLYAVYVIQHGCTDRSECVLITGLEISNENADKVNHIS